MIQDIEQNGFSVCSGVIGPTEQQQLLSTVGLVSGAGSRGILGFPAVAGLARSERLLGLVRPHLPSEPPKPQPPAKPVIAMPPGVKLGEKDQAWDHAPRPL